MAGWLARAGCGPAGVRLERETHPLLLQVSNQHFSVLAALRCACPAPPHPMIVTLLTVCCKRCLQERWPGPGARGERGDSDCCAVLCCAAQGSCVLVCAGLTGPMRVTLTCATMLLPPAGFAHRMRARRAAHMVQQAQPLAVNALCMCACAVTALAAQVGSKTDKTSGVRTAALFRMQRCLSTPIPNVIRPDFRLSSSISSRTKHSTRSWPA